MKLLTKKWIVYLLITIMAVPTIFLTSIAGAKPVMAATSEPTATPTVAESPTITPEPTTLEPTPTQSPSQWTFEKVELNKEYVAPQNSEVKLTFTKLPSSSGNIKIEQISLTKEQIEQTGSLSDKAYDITSDMVDGSFAYNLSLPIPESSKGKAVEVKFAEELSNIGTAEKVENTLTKTDTSVSVNSLDHFTIFIVVDDGGSNYVDNGWNNYTTAGYNGDHHWVNPTQTGKVATWTFTGTTGEYAILPSWVIWNDHATNAHYTSTNITGFNLTGVDQKIPANTSVTSSSDGTWSGWFPNTGRYNLVSGNTVTLSVETSTTDGNLAADAIAFVGMNDIYVDASWAGDVMGQDLSGGKIFGVNAFATIQEGITAVTAGGTVNVAAGTYHEQVIIDKAVSVLGASAAATFIDGTGVTPVLPGLVNITNETGAVTLDGFTIRNAPASGGTRITIWAKQAEEGPVYCSSMTITHNILVGSGHLVSTDDYGLYSSYNKSNLVFSYNDVSNFGGNAFLFELHTGPAEISHNAITVDPDCGSTAFFSMSYKDGYGNNNDVTGKQWLHDNTINANGESAITIASAVGFAAYNDNTYGAYTNVEITDNVITNVGDAKKGIQLEVDGDNGGFVNSPIIARNTISAQNPNPGSGTSRGIRIMGVVTDAQILDNGITGFYRGIFQSDSFSHLVYPAGTLISGNAITGGTYGVDIAGGTATIHLNSIVGNTLFGVNNQTVATIDATNNWWGNASGPYDNKTLPGTPNYNNPLGTGDSVTSYVDYKPWYTNAEMTTLNYMAPTFTTSAGQGKSINITFSNVQPGTTEYDVYINGKLYAIYFPTASTYNILVANYGAYSIYAVARYGSAFSTNSVTQTLTLSAPAAPVAKSSVGSSLAAPSTAQAATTAPTTIPSVDEQGQIKGEETAETTDNGKINWTPWIILFILILLAGAATGGYFYWFGGDNEAEGATVAVKEKKIEEPKTAAAKKPASGTNKKSRRW